jgi:glucose dehydrogenase
MDRSWKQRRIHNRGLVVKPEEKRPVGGARHMWLDNIKMEFNEMGWGFMAWIDVAQDRDQWRALVNMVMNLRVPYKAGKFLNGCTTGGLSRRSELHTVS